MYSIRLSFSLLCCKQIRALPSTSAKRFARSTHMTRSPCPYISLEKTRNTHVVSTSFLIPKEKGGYLLFQNSSSLPKHTTPLCLSSYSVLATNNKKGASIPSQQRRRKVLYSIEYEGTEKRSRNQRLLETQARSQNPYIDSRSMIWKSGNRLSDIRYL